MPTNAPDVVSKKNGVIGRETAASAAPGRQPDNYGGAGRQAVQGDGVPRDRREGRTIDYRIVTRSSARLHEDRGSSTRRATRSRGIPAIRRFEPFSRVQAVNERDTIVTDA